MYGLEENAVRYVLVHGNDVITFFAVWISKTLVRVMRFRRKGRFQSFLDRNRSENLQQFQFKRTTKGSDAGKEETWRDGRRVIELGFLIDRLKECEKCKQALCLSNIVSEKQFGLASILHIVCQRCSYINYVATGKRHRTSDTGAARCFDVNTKLAAGKIVDNSVTETFTFKTQLCSTLSYNKCAWFLFAFAFSFEFTYIATVCILRVPSTVTVIA